jgi:hypothetical protein
MASVAPRAWGDRVTAIFLFDLMPKSLNVKDAFERFYKNNPACNVQYSTLTEWWRHWEQYGELPGETARRHKREKRKRANRKKVTAPMKAHLQRLLEDQPDLYLDELQDSLYLKGGDTWWLCPSAILRVLVEDFKWSLRKYQSKARQSDAVNRSQCSFEGYARKYVQLL